MQIDVILTAEEVKTDEVFQKTIIIVDIFRTSSTIISAFANGIKQIIPAETIGQAKTFKNQNDQYLLAGDRYYKKAPGFDLGNSPTEIQNSELYDKTLILTTTNGIRSIQKTLKGENLLIGGFLNGAYCMKQALKLKRDVALLAVGDKGNIALEDWLAIGFLISRLKELTDEPIEISDIGLGMYGMYKYYEKDLPTLLKETETAKKISQHGLAEDIDFSIQIDKYPLCPYVNNDKIIDVHKD